MSWKLEIDPKRIKHKFIDTPPFFVKKCFGKRLKAYKKCESCEDITNCSADTLMRVLTNEGFNVTTSQFGELIHVDKLEE